MNIRFLFLDESDTSGESQVFYCEELNTLTLQVTSEGAVDLSVQARNDVEEDEFVDCAAIKLADHTAVESISATGMYMVPLTGIAQIKVKNNGTAGGCKVFGIGTDAVASI